MGVSLIYPEFGMVVIQSSELVDLFKTNDVMSTRECRVYAPHSACTVWFTGLTHGQTRPSPQKHGLTVNML
jgi:hypothetical protein